MQKSFRRIGELGEECNIILEKNLFPILATDYRLTEEDVKDLKQFSTLLADMIVMENTDPSDVFLTPEWSMNRFILAGRPMYYGWPYYAWSAGHDTYTRDTIYLWLITGCGGDIDEFTRYCKERGIKYLIADPEFEQTDYGNGIYFNKRFFEENLTQAAYFAEENTTIYRIY